MSSVSGHPNRISTVGLTSIGCRLVLILPKFNIPEDQEAYEQIARLMPNYKDRIEMVDATDLIRYEGCLNCASWVVEDYGDLQEVPVRL